MEDVELKRSIQGGALAMVLTIILAFGKLTGTWAELSWWWVFAPFWLPYAFGFGLLALIFVMVVFSFIVGGFYLTSAIIIEAIKRKRENKS